MLADVGPGGVGLVDREHPVRRGRDAVAAAEFLGEGLGAFETRGRGGRTEHRNAGGLQPVDQAEHQRQLGPRHDQLDALVPAKGGDAGEIVDLERHTGRLARNGIAARCAVQLIDQRRCGERPAERMLTSARAHDQHLHAPPDVIAPLPVVAAGRGKAIEFSGPIDERSVA